MEWFRQWKKYTGFDSEAQDGAGQARGHPGPIDNALLFKSNSNILLSLIMYIYNVYPLRFCSALCQFLVL